MLDSSSQKVPYIAGPRGEVEVNGGNPSKGSVGRGIPCIVFIISGLGQRQTADFKDNCMDNRHHVTSDNVHMWLHMEIM